MCVVLCTGTTDRDKQLYITNSSNMQMHRNQTQHLVANIHRTTKLIIN